MIWFTSDLHLGHANILHHAKRPFDDVGQMNDWIIDAINDRVSWSDELWVLGDFAYRVSADEVRAFRERIVCRNVRLVRGNHDVRFPHGESPFGAELGYYDELRTNPPDRRQLVLFHYPILDWNGMNAGSIHLHGHIHEDRAYNERNRAQGLLRYDVGVDAHDFVPVSITDVEEFFAGVEPRSIHHRA
ncbi:MAG: metallophosphoesterase family protein [Coriobacteriales bacterium]|nr:metallophosphoesterase family protein [Coriobacteriales bacterium]